MRECDQAESRREKEVSREVVIPGFNSLSGRYQHINVVRLAITSHLTSSQSYPSHPYTSAQTTSAVTKIIGKSGPVLIPTPHPLFSTFHFTFESAPSLAAGIGGGVLAFGATPRAWLRLRRLSVYHARHYQLNPRFAPRPTLGPGRRAGLGGVTRR